MMQTAVKTKKPRKQAVSGRFWAERTYRGRIKDDHKIDPCVGSGHFLVYAFEVLMKIYVEFGYSERDAASEILKNNLYGVDIDGRATQLAYFAVMMKARRYDRRFFTRDIHPRIYEIIESNNVDIPSIQYFYGNDGELQKNVKIILDVLKDAKEYGSILQIPEVDFTRIYDRFNELEDEVNLYNPYLLGEFKALINEAEVLSKKYTIVATNPPYLNKYDDELKNFVNRNYKKYAGDLFSVFMYRNFDFCRCGGYSSFMTPFVWMFIKTYEELRKLIINEKQIVTLIQMEYSAYEEATVPICAFVLQNGKSRNNGLCFKLSDFVGGMDVQRQKVLEAISNPECGYFYESDEENYLRINGEPIAFWASEKMLYAFENYPTIAELSPPKQGLATANNDRFLRLWFEPNINKVGFGISNCEEAENSGLKWFPYNKGGAFRRWYGNRDYVVNWEQDGYEIRNFKDDKGKVRSRPQNTAYYFKEAITWSDITSAAFSGRYSDTGFMFDVKGSSGFPTHDKIFYILGFLNSSVSQKCIKILNPTITTQVGDMARIPVVLSEDVKGRVEELVRNNISIAKKDWDSFETSWDFKRHPLVRKCLLIEEAYSQWKTECDDRFSSLKKNEEELNDIFIRLYGLTDEMRPDVTEKEVEASCHRADLKRDITSLISYAVGCMFGRYSLDQEGLVYAGGVWDNSNYVTYEADSDAIIPISDDEYFDDDIVCRFINFVEVVYGKDNLEENLEFIAKALGGKGGARETIRDYFLNSFFTDHCNNYSVSGSGKRPIYWLFDSGKKNGFKCLIYMHRYQADTIARIRTDYVHEQQARYRTAIEEITNRMEQVAGTDKVKLTKKLNVLKEQDEEIHVYEEKIHHLADQMISIELDDGVKTNYEIFADVLAKLK